jgi:hypothetical protein
MKKRKKGKMEARTLGDQKLGGRPRKKKDTTGRNGEETSRGSVGGGEIQSNVDGERGRETAR